MPCLEVAACGVTGGQEGGRGLPGPPACTGRGPSCAGAGSPKRTNRGAFAPSEGAQQARVLSEEQRPCQLRAPPCARRTAGSDRCLLSKCAWDPGPAAGGWAQGPGASQLQEPVRVPPSRLLPLSPSSCPRFTECFSSQSFDFLLPLPVLPRTSPKEFREQSSHFCVCVKITC